MAKYKDYPVYTYDEPATYRDFSGGINTDPSNEHLQANEMRDCLNMHYSSAALVKRKGASLLCNIQCEDELFNVQGVFLFTYRVTYIIIAADGKLYKGFYSPNATITLTRLPIEVEIPESSNLYNPIDCSVGLPEYIYENINMQHEGFIYNYLVDSQNSRILLDDDNYLGEYLNLPENYLISPNQIVLYNNKYYQLTGNPINKKLITPTDTAYWVSLAQYNETYKQEIATRLDILSRKKESNTLNSGLLLDTTHNTWVSTAFPGNWKEKYSLWYAGDIVNYNGEIYVCIQDHSNHAYSPQTLISEGGFWYPLVQKKELIFQNSSSIEAATYNNKMYFTTGTRFIVVELSENKLIARIVKPYQCNTEEIINIGYNYLSPYPELCRTSMYDQVITSIGGVVAIKQLDGTYLLQPQMNFAQGETEQDYCFKWEKCIDKEWIVIYSYKDNYLTVNDAQVKNNYYTITVPDADKYQYRVSFAKAFEKAPDNTESWNYSTPMYYRGDLVLVTNGNGTTELYRCLIEHCPKEVIWDNIEYELTPISLDPYANIYYQTYQKDAIGHYLIKSANPIFSAYTTTRAGNSIYTKTADGEFKLDRYDTRTIITGKTYWEKVYTEEAILKEDGVSTDWIVDKISGDYFGQAVSTISVDLSPEDKFNVIHSCKKILSDGNKFLLYDDKYNSGSWYKTVIDNPAYITDRGGLSFKTNKNETLIKVVAFNGNLIAFANSENIGGSIHMITGNGDDWDDQSGYYSPYRRSTINATVSCDNAKTVQVCENILVFKYFNTLYYISGSELNNEVVSVYSCNDKIKHNNNFITIPWEDNSCISEVTEDYYALIWKEKYIIENEELILDRPALKIKMYYKLGVQQNEKIVYPWLRDESDYFNIDHIVYVKGKPIYLYNNTLTTFHNEKYTDFNNVYKCEVHFRGEDLNYPKMSKLINNVLVYYHRNQYSTIDFDLLVKNEAGHVLLDSTIKRVSLQDLRALRAEDKVIDGEIRLDSTILDSKVFNTAYKFPCLLADTIITAANDKEFSISSITYNYITSETPDQTAYDLYSNILRPKEVK